MSGRIRRDSHNNKCRHKPLKVKRGREIDICVQKFSSPYDFLAKVLHSKNSKKIVALQQEIESHFNDHYLFSKSIVTDPEVGQYCVARTKDGVLHRAMIIKTYVSGNFGFLSYCALVDEAKHACVPNRSLYEAPDWVWHLPIQSGCFGLHGIIPSKLRADYFEDTVKKVPCSRSRWDPAAIAYLIRICANENVLKAVVMETDSSGVVWVDLFMPVCSKRAGYVSVNEELVRKEYAAVGTRDIDCDVEVSSEERLLWLMRKAGKQVAGLKSNFSCQEIEDGGEPRVLAPSSTHGIGQVSYGMQQDEVICPEVIPNEHVEDSNSVTFLKRKKKRHSPDKRDQGKFFTKNGICMRSIGLQVGGDANCDTVETSEDEPLCRNFSCNVTESDLEPKVYLKVRNPKANAEHQVHQVSLNLDKREKMAEKSDGTFRLRHNDFLIHAPSEICSESDESGTSTSIPEKLDEDEDSEADENQRKTRMSKAAQGPIKSVFVPDKLHSGSVVLIRGSKPPNPLPLFCKTPFSPQFLRILEADLDLRGPKLIQAYVWPALLRKRDVIAIAPACGGKSLAYIVPIAHMLINDNKVCGNSGEQPSVIVITPNWTKAEKLRNLFMKFLGTSQRIRNVMTVCGGSPEEEMKASRLASGCSVLICSAPSFIRICNANYVDLSRLKHLVLDCIHLLVEEFFEEMKSIMIILANVLRTAAAHLQNLNPPQIIGMGSMWTKGIESYMKFFSKNRPLLLISDPLEAAVFGNVQHKVFSTTYEDCLTLLQDFFRSYEWDGAVAVFTDTPKSVETFADIFKSHGMYSVKAHGNMSHGELDMVRQELSHDTSQLILFATDDAVPHLDVYSIKTVIHLNLPMSSHQFGIRLSVMQALFDNESTAQNIERGRSIFFINEQETDRTPDLVKFFERIPIPVPAKLLSMAEEALKGGHGVKMSIPICPTLKFLGLCTDESVCKYRHQLTPNDKLTDHGNYSVVPAAGHVRLKVTHVTDATHYFGVCVAVKNDSGVITKFSDGRPIIARDVKECLKSSYEDILLTGDPHPGVLYATAKTFQRVVALRLSKPEVHNQEGTDFVIANYKQKLSTTFVCWTTPAGVRKVCVRFVDSGRVGIVRCDELFKIPNDLQSIPWQAIEIRVCGVRPNDRDRKWLPLADHLVHENIFDKDLEGVIVAKLGHTIWISPAVIRCKLPITKTIDTEFSVVQELLQKKYAQKYPEHIELISNFISGTLRKKSEIPVTKPVKRFPPASNDDTNVDIAQKKDPSNMEPSISTEYPAVQDSQCHIVNSGTSGCSVTRLSMDSPQLVSMTRNLELQTRSISLTEKLKARNGKPHLSDYRDTEEPKMKFEITDIGINDCYNVKLPVKANKPVSLTVKTQAPNPKCEITENGACDYPDFKVSMKATLPASQAKISRVNSTHPPTLAGNLKVQNAYCINGTSSTSSHCSDVEHLTADSQIASLPANLGKDSAERHIANRGTISCSVEKKVMSERSFSAQIENVNDSTKRVVNGNHTLEANCPVAKTKNDSKVEKSCPDSDDFDKSLESLCKKFCNIPLSESDRMNILLEIHVFAVGCFYDLSLEDLQSLANVLPATRTVKEALTVVGALLSLILDDVPIANSIELVPLVKTACSLKIHDEDCRQLSVMLFKLIQAFIESFDVNDRVDPGHLSQTGLMEVISDLEQYLRCRVDERVYLEAIQALEMARNHWARKKSSEVVVKKPENSKQSQRRSTPKKLKPKTCDRYGINYDRFQDIATETTDVESLKQPYTPIPVKYDSDTSSSFDSDDIMIN